MMRHVQSVVQRLTTSVGVAACSALAAMAGMIGASVDRRYELVAAFAFICGYCIAMATVLIASQALPRGELVGRAVRVPRAAKVKVEA